MVSLTWIDYFMCGFTITGTVVFVVWFALLMYRASQCTNDYVKSLGWGIRP